MRWGTALNWTTTFKLVERVPVIGAYIDPVPARPAAPQDEVLAASQDKM